MFYNIEQQAEKPQANSMDPIRRTGLMQPLRLGHQVPIFY